MEDPVLGEGDARHCPTQRLRFRSAGSPLVWSAAAASHLHRRLRMCGHRCSMLLEGGGCYLHVTPLRATRPLALRWLAAAAGVPLDAGVLVVVFSGGDGDVADLIAGVQKVSAPRGRGIRSTRSMFLYNVFSQATTAGLKPRYRVA